MSFLAFKSVEKTFWKDQNSSFTALNDFSLDLEEGQFFSLLGPTAAKRLY